LESTILKSLLKMVEYGIYNFVLYNKEITQMDITEIESYKKIYKDYGINTPCFSLSGFKICARLVDILDGDSVRVVIQLFGDFYQFNIRINGIDTCEIKSKSAENKDRALRARGRICELVTEIMLIDRKAIKNHLSANVYIVQIECFNFDKYGRLLANVMTCGNKNIGQTLIDEKLAYVYNGKTKLTETEQNNLLNN
jgi:endonuclease YncB( thermonuclease family)